MLRVNNSRHTFRHYYHLVIIPKILLGELRIYHQKKNERLMILKAYQTIPVVTKTSQADKTSWQWEPWELRDSSFLDVYKIKLYSILKILLCQKTKKMLSSGPSDWSQWKSKWMRYSWMWYSREWTRSFEGNSAHSSVNIHKNQDLGNAVKLCFCFAFELCAHISCALI